MITSGSIYVTRQREDILIKPFSLHEGIIKKLPESDDFITTAEQWTCLGCGRTLKTKVVSPLETKGPSGCMCGSKKFIKDKPNPSDLEDCQVYTVQDLTTKHSYQVLLTSYLPENMNKFDKVSITDASLHQKGREEMVVAHHMQLMLDERSDSWPYSNY